MIWSFELSHPGAEWLNVRKDADEAAVLTSMRRRARTVLQVELHLLFLSSFGSTQSCLARLLHSTSRCTPTVAPGILHA